MIHGIVATLSIAAFGLFAARVGDLRRVSFLRRSSCDETRSTSYVWSFNADAAQSQRTWLNVRRHGTC